MIGIIRSGINVAQHELSLVSNNLANAKTTGFKTSAGRFQDQYSVALEGITPANGMGSNISKSSRIHSQGALIQTDGALDLSVIGNGMFVLGPPQGINKPYYTRDGAINLDQKGNLLTSDGLPYLGKIQTENGLSCLLYTSPSPRDRTRSRMPSSA